MHVRRLVSILLALLLSVAVTSILPSAASASAAAGPAPSDSAVTVSGKGDFSNLKVTVDQTRNLVNQAVAVSWTGGAPTAPLGAFGVNYLQIMQCWGDDPAGPDRAQCQYGGLDSQSSPSAGDFVRTRQVTSGSNLVDPEETLKGPAGSPDNAFVPFWAVGRPKPTGPATSDRSDFFDSQVTNEIPLARTHADGAGQELVEVETVRQAAGLGCGDPVTSGEVTAGRSCWLVIVARGNHEVDGSTRTAQSTSDYLASSPLSQSNWDNRIVVPLEFQPVGQACPIGAPERQVIGHELAVDAVGSWQPALCAGGGALYSYTQLSDDVTRSQVLGGSSPGLALVTNPIPPDQVPTDHPLVYAPVGLSGLTIAFNIEHQPPPTAPNGDLQLNGVRFTSMKLTPRLVAKLLTQSYQGAVVGPPDYLKNNPSGLTVDPEFLDLNPEYKGFASSTTPPDALVQLGSSDLTSLLWSWVQADPDARAFLAGSPDPVGMVVNPNNKDLTLPTSVLPRNDQSCIDNTLSNGVTGKICTLDAHPFTTDMHDAGRSASRGDTQAKTIVLGPGNTPVSQPVGRQAPGQRALLAVVDTATATRYGLPTAQLRNAAEQFVAPTPESLLAGEAAMKPSAVPGVLASDPGATDPGSYPLTALSYAVTAPSTLDAATGKDYAALLRYAVGPGQQSGTAPGQLPLGMVPLPDALKTQTIAAAATIEAQAGTTTATTTTAVEVTPASPVAVGTTETLTATVTPTPTGQPAVGSVQFQDGTAPLGSAVALSGATASLTTILPSGTHSLTAVFTPTDPTALSSSTSPPVTYVVNAATGAVATTTTLTGSPNPAFPIILRATVTPPTAVGTVEFTDGTTPLAAPIPVIGGTAAVFTPTLTPGTHALTATFIPTDPTTFTPSSSAPMSVAVTTQSLQITTLLHNLLQSLLAGLHL